MNKLSKFLDLASDQNTLMENRDIYSRVHTALLDLAEHGGVCGSCKGQSKGNMKAISTGGLEVVVVKTLGRPTHGRVLSSFRCCKIRDFVKRDPCVNAHPAKPRRYMNDFVTGVPRRLF